jgi:hypothetical protein
MVDHLGEFTVSVLHGCVLFWSPDWSGDGDSKIDGWLSGIEHRRLGDPAAFLEEIHPCGKQDTLQRIILQGLI